MSKQSTPIRMLELHTLKTEDVFEHPDHYREVKPERVDELADRVKATRLLDPIAVQRDGDIYIVVAGHHRLAAAKKLGIKQLQAYILDDADDADVKTAMVGTNYHAPESESEHVKATQLLIATGVPFERIAHAVTEDVERVKRAARGWASLNDETAAEDVPFEWAVALDEFPKGTEAHERIKAAKANEWQRVVADVRRERKVAAARAEKVALVEAAGIPLVDTFAHDRDYLGHGDTPPDGAEVAMVYVDYGGAASVKWWGAVSATAPTPEQVEAREKAEAAREAMHKAQADRLAHIATTLGGMCDKQLKTVAEAAWERTGVFAAVPNVYDSGFAADSKRLGESLASVHGLATRMIASVLALLDSTTTMLLGGDCLNASMVPAKGAQTVAYLDALIASGYEPNEGEAERITALRAALKPQKKSKKEAAE